MEQRINGFWIWIYERDVSADCRCRRVAIAKGIIIFTAAIVLSHSSQYLHTTPTWTGFSRLDALTVRPFTFDHAHTHTHLNHIYPHRDDCVHKWDGGQRPSTIRCICICCLCVCVPQLCIQQMQNIWAFCAFCRRKSNIQWSAPVSLSSLPLSVSATRSQLSQLSRMGVRATQ